MDTPSVMKARNITIYDIAREAGVSAATVSRVLTNNANVRPEKRQKVQALIEKYNFKPNALAKGLSDTRSKIIGIMVADVRNPFYAEIFVACELAAESAGYTVLLCNSLGETSREQKQLELFHEQRISAMIQLGGRVDDLVSDADYVEAVNQLTNNIPVVVSGKLDGTLCYQVEIDSMKAMDLLMEHLIDLGHRRIALAGGRLDVSSSFQKLQRYKQILKNYRIDFRPEYVIEGGYDYQAGHEAMERLLKCDEIPTAVIAINDYTALGVMNSIQEHGYRIPQDIAVAGYDNTQIATLVHPHLTSIDYQYETFGKMLVGTAVTAVEGGEVSRIQLVTPKLMIRASTMPEESAD